MAKKYSKSIDTINSQYLLKNMWVMINGNIYVNKNII